MDVEQLGGHVARPLHGFLLGFAPLFGAEFVQRRVFGADAGIAADQMQGGYRHVNLVAAGVFQHQELGFDAADGQGLQAQVTADAVFLVHHRRADGQFVEVIEDVFQRPSRGLGPAPALLDFFAAELALGDDGQRWFFEQQPVVHRCDDDARRLFAVQKLRPALHLLGGQFDAFQFFDQAFAVAGGFGDEQNFAGKAFDKLAQALRRLFQAAIDRYIGQCLTMQRFALFAW